jgi:integrase
VSLGRKRLRLATRPKGASGVGATRGVDTSEGATYTEEEPNALAAVEVAWLHGKGSGAVSQHYAMLALGLATGPRPSELRPLLRRKGPAPDVFWEDGVLLLRRSETMGRVRETTKTGRRLRIVALSQIRRLELMQGLAIPLDPPQSLRQR